MFLENSMLKVNRKLGGQNSTVGRYGVEGNAHTLNNIPFLDIPHIVPGWNVTHLKGGRRRTNQCGSFRRKQGHCDVRYCAAIRD